MSHPHDKRERFLLSDSKGKRRLKSYMPMLRGPNGSLSAESFLKKEGRKRRDTTKQCSCAMCGNPRKFFNEESLQERKVKSSP